MTPDRPHSPENNQFHPSVLILAEPQVLLGAMRQTLAEAGCTVFAAPNPHQAQLLLLQQARADHPIQILFTDIKRAADAARLQDQRTEYPAFITLFWNSDSSDTRSNVIPLSSLSPKFFQQTLIDNFRPR